MRIWSIHPKYLDTKGLLALWRETLLAKNVLEGKTRGYRNHPQLIRFKEAESPLNCIHLYLKGVWEEAHARNYRFDSGKFDKNLVDCSLLVSTDQIEFERKHLLNKLKTRDIESFLTFDKLNKISTHPIFNTYNGDIESWERIK